MARMSASLTLGVPKAAERLPMLNVLPQLKTIDCRNFANKYPI
jgi:hypothetical protein